MGKEKEKIMMVFRREIPVTEKTKVFLDNKNRAVIAYIIEKFYPWRVQGKPKMEIYDLFAAHFNVSPHNITKIVKENGFTYDSLLHLSQKVYEKSLVLITNE